MKLEDVFTESEELELCVAKYQFPENYFNIVPSRYKPVMCPGAFVTLCRFSMNMILAYR